jgi:hypothetical protein
MAPAPTSRPAAAAPDVPPLGAEPEAARAAVAPGAPPSTVAASVATPGSGVVTEVADTARTPRRRDRSATRLPRRQPAAAASDVVGTVAEPAPLIAPPARSPSPPPVKVWDPDSPVPP